MAPKPAPKPERGAPGVLVLATRACPSLVTMAALFCGLSAVRAAATDDFSGAIAWLTASGVCDGLDGHVARYLDAVTLFGGELDSLCDLVDFGAAPALIMYLWIANHTTDHVVSDAVAWLCCCVFAVACAYRLARFNVGTLQSPQHLHDHTYPATRPDASIAPPSSAPPAFSTQYLARSKFFRGLSAPMGAAIAVNPILLEQGGFWVPPSPPSPLLSFLSQIDARLYACALMAVVGLLMVSGVPTLSGKLFMRDTNKESHLRNRSVFTLSSKVAALALVVGLLARYPWHMLLFVQVLCFSTMPLGVVLYHHAATDK